jgi:hypothetical protein
LQSGIIHRLSVLAARSSNSSAMIKLAILAAAFFTFANASLLLGSPLVKFTGPSFKAGSLLLDNPFWPTSSPYYRTPSLGYSVASPYFRTSPLAYAPSSPFFRATSLAYAASNPFYKSPLVYTTPTSYLNTATSLGYPSPYKSAWY